MKVYILIASFFLFVSNAIAQGNGKITGSITSENMKSLQGATVSLLRSKDSAIVKLAAVDKKGSFSFEKIPDGKYVVGITAVGHRNIYSTIIEINTRQQLVQLPDFTLTPVSNELAGVTVTSRKQLIEQRIDRTIVNVDASITNIGTTALEVLEKSPGVSVDNDGNISLKGKEGVLVMIDDRPTQLRGADLANLLRNMSSNQMDQVEIITNPPARYDASGTSGIINIKTKKTITAGFNGTATLTYSQGRYPKTNEGFNFNYRNGKINMYTNLSHNYQKGFGNIKIDRNIFDNTGSVKNIFDQEAHRISTGNSFSGKFGLDFFATKKTTVGFSLSGSSRNMLSDNQNTTHIFNAGKTLEGVTKAMVNNDTEWKNFGANINMRTVLDKKGRQITADLDYLNYGSSTHQFMVNAYNDAAGNEMMKADSLKGYLPQDIKVLGGRIDYLHPINKTARFEAGIKSSVVRTDNNVSYDSIQNGIIVHDFHRSNHFVYEENVNAAYANLSTPLSKKISAQFGLRVENTNAKGVQRTTGQRFERHYTQLFPTAYFQYKANDQNNFGASFGRRVRRPDYSSLNPFIRFIDRYTYSQGNPNLKPSVSYNIELSHTWNNKITTSVNYSVVNDLIEGVIEQKGQDAYTTPFNIASMRQFGLSISANNAITKWWTSNININVFNNRTKGEVSKADINFTATSFIINGTQQFKLNKTLTAELNGRYRNGWLEGVLRARPVGFIGAGLSQQILKGKGTVRFSVRDMFYTQKFRGRATYGNVDFSIVQANETRVFSLGFSYRFSKGKVAPVKRTAGSANEEQERIGD